ncbi:MAG TPA: TetR family transcriptional regulator [Streptosporangiaceae bacterium]|nr:TetR family transcriptional regulator [Streptosporangiaceae bacterium]
MTEAGGKQDGLRERKKAKTRAAIRQHALRLFREQGYSATTIEQIVDAAEVSPATFFRYFPSKEDVVLQDDFDIVTIEALEAQPPELSPVAAFRAAAADTLASLTAEDIDRFRDSVELTFTIPEIRSRAIDEFVRTINQIAAAIARRTGRRPDDFEVRVVAGAIIGVIMSVTITEDQDTWNAGGFADITELFSRIDTALSQLERGLPMLTRTLPESASGRAMG